jgi:hypothetical protein
LIPFLRGLLPASPFLTSSFTTQYRHIRRTHWTPALDGSSYNTPFYVDIMTDYSPAFRAEVRRKSILAGGDVGMHDYSMYDSDEDSYYGGFNFGMGVYDESDSEEEVREECCVM